MLKELLKNHDEKVIKAFIEDIHAHDLADLFVDLTEEEKEQVYHLLSNEQLAELVSYLEVDDAADVLVDFDIHKQVELVEMMEPDDAADIILEMEPKEQEELLEKLGEDSEVKELIQYEDDETGSAMTNLYVVVSPHMDVKQATKKVIQEADEVESINTIFVADENNIYLGAISLKDLLKAKTPLDVEALIEDYPVSIDTDPISKTIQAIRNYAIYEMPVINEHRELIGMITLDDALDIYQEEAQEDFEKLAALPETEEDMSPLRTAIHRLPWLLVLLVISIPIALVTRQFEHVLVAVAILIVFQPLILDSAGNVATQTLAVTLQMLSTHEKGLFKNALRELLTGVINGLVIGLIAFIMTNIFALINPSLASNPLLIGLVVGLSLWLTVIISPIIAFIIPMTLHVIKLDPAVASGPFITTIIDVSALFIYFGLAKLMLGVV
ncbi:MAG: magnesium transporter [Acholeplasmataceae bacterium]|jgi:magnesium transporter|nr:magnesium transporter [Acholeplasmataceae bacterium]